MEDKKEMGNVCTCCGACGCGGKGMMGMHKHRMLRRVLMFVLLLITFCFGAQFGELKGELRAGRGGYEGHGMMRGDYGYGNNFGYPVPMMYQGQNLNSTPKGTTPVAPSGTTTTVPAQ